MSKGIHFTLSNCLEAINKVSVFDISHIRSNLHLDRVGHALAVLSSHVPASVDEQDDGSSIGNHTADHT